MVDYIKIPMTDSNIMDAATVNNFGIDSGGYKFVCLLNNSAYIFRYGTSNLLFISKSSGRVNVYWTIQPNYDSYTTIGLTTQRVEGGISYIYTWVNRQEMYNALTELNVFNSLSECLNIAFTLDYTPYYISDVKSPITYIPINSTLSGPESASSGETVNVSVSFPDGYIYQETGVQIYNQNGTISFTYSDGQITFTMP